MNKYYLNEKTKDGFYNIIELYFDKKELIMAECDPEKPDFPYKI